MLAGMVQFVHGWIPDSDHKKVKDYNARLLLDRVSAPPPSASLRHLIPSILNQGNLGYYYARAASPGNTQVDSGTQIRCVFDAIRKLGYCPESAWPYDIDTFTFMPGAAAVRAAYDQRSIYYRITSTGAQRITDICTAVAGDHAVVFGTPVSNSIFNADPTKPLGPPIGEEIVGGHAMTVVGYKPGRVAGIVDFDIVNSWGEEWGDHGYFTMADTYLAWSETTDLWIAEIAA
jgi:hypothetical protein